MDQPLLHPRNTYPNAHWNLRFTITEIACGFEGPKQCGVQLGSEKEANAEDGLDASQKETLTDVSKLYLLGESWKNALYRERMF